MKQSSGWQDMDWFDICKISNEETRKEYHSQYFQYIYYISQYIQEELANRGLEFEYSGTIKSMTIQQMSDELNFFCEEHGILEKERQQIVLQALIRDLIKRKEFDKANMVSDKYHVSDEEIKGKKR